MLLIPTVLTESEILVADIYWKLMWVVYSAMNRNPTEVGGACRLMSGAMGIRGSMINQCNERRGWAAMRELGDAQG